MIFEEQILYRKLSLWCQCICTNDVYFILFHVFIKSYTAIHADTCSIGTFSTPFWASSQINIKLSDMINHRESLNCRIHNLLLPFHEYLVSQKKGDPSLHKKVIFSKELWLFFLRLGLPFFWTPGIQNIIPHTLRQNLYSNLFFSAYFIQTISTVHSQRVQFF